MATAENKVLTDHITQLGERAAEGSQIEIVEVEVRGAGRSRLVRVYIDKPAGIDHPAGVTHGDCELISVKLGQLLDEADIIPDDGYTLEVSSPGIERRLSKPRDFERVVGQKIKLTTTEPIDGYTSLVGTLEEVASGTLGIQITPGHLVQIPLSQVRKANLKFDW